MKVIEQLQHQQLGYMWESGDTLHKRARMQFADAAALITHNTNSVQALWDIAVTQSTMQDKHDTSNW